MAQQTLKRNTSGLSFVLITLVLPEMRAIIRITTIQSIKESLARKLNREVGHMSGQGILEFVWDEALTETFVNEAVNEVLSQHPGSSAEVRKDTAFTIVGI
jgi:hypothetical protein